MYKVIVFSTYVIILALVVTIFILNINVWAGIVGGSIYAIFGLIWIAVRESERRGLLR